jgi:hypothetical protein
MPRAVFLSSSYPQHPAWATVVGAAERAWEAADREVADSEEAVEHRPEAAVARHPNNDSPYHADS